MNCPVCRNFVILGPTSEVHFCMCDKLKCYVYSSTYQEPVYRWTFRYSAWEELEFKDNILSVFTWRGKVRRVVIPEASREVVVHEAILLSLTNDVMES